MIIRHLVLPGHTECCTKPILRFIAENLPHSLVNIMDQYHPDYKVQIFPEEYKEISKNVSKEEIEQARYYAKELNITFEHIS
jgi:putative pyruvate formate lyase activating enzyme